MMGFFRSKLFKGIIMWIMAIVFAAMFGLVVAGVDPGAMFGGGAPWVLKINGEKVEAQAYQDVLRMMSGRMQIGYQDNVDLHAVASNEIIRDTLHMEQARELKTSLDISSIKRAVTRDPEIGQDYARYMYLQEAMRLNAVWRERAAAGVRSLLNLLPVVSTQEIEADYIEKNAKAVLRYATFVYEDYVPNIEISDEEAQAFYDANQEMFWQGEAINLEFVKLNIAFAPYEATEEDIADYYERRKSEFFAEQRRARHILLKDEEDTPEARAATEKKAQELLEQAKAEGADFAALATEHSADPGSAALGGDLGWFDDKTMVPEFTEAAFSLVEEGDISEPVRTSFGVHIIKLEGKRDYKPLEEARDDIRTAIRTARQSDRAREDVQELYFEIDSTGGPEEALTKEQFAPYNAVLTATGFFSRYDTFGGDLDAAFRNADVNRAVFIAPLEQWSEPIQVIERGELQSYLLIRVNEKRSEGAQPLDEVKSDIETILKGQKARELASAAAEKLYAQLAEGDSLDDLVKKYAPGENDPAELTPQETSEFSAILSGYINGIGLSREATAAAFRMTEGEIQGVFEGESGAFIMELKQKTDANLEELTDEKRQEIRRRLLTRKQNSARESWYQDVRNAANIEYNAKALADY